MGKLQCCFSEQGCEDSEVLQQYFGAKQDQDDTACDLCFLFVTLSEHVSDLYAKCGEKECDCSDKKHCHRYVRIRQIPSVYTLDTVPRGSPLTD